jgi:hypothetical protein
MSASQIIEIVVIGMLTRRARTIVAAGFLLAAVPACASQVRTSSVTVAVAENGYGSHSTVMLHVVLRTDGCGEDGAQLSIQASSRPGVLFTNYTPAGGLVVGIVDKADVSPVERWLRSQAAVVSVNQVTLPSGPPASAPKTAPTC